MNVMPDNNNYRILRLYKEQYEKPVMNDKAVFEMKQRMEQGKKEKRSMLRKKAYKVLAIAASVALAIMILPNTSKTLAYATGKKVESADLFKKGSDYRKIISDNIKKQMKEQMTPEDGFIYWVDNEEFPEWNFKEITDNTSFYINRNGELVICFNEGEVAPASMGTVEFTIPKDVVAGIIN